MNCDDKTITAKTVAMCVLFSASATLGTFPIILSRIFRWNSDSEKNPYVQKLLCLGGGVLLCTTFIHLLPEVSEKITRINSIPIKSIHYAELLMCAGFFIIYFIEECVHTFLHRHSEETVLVRSLSVRLGSMDSDKAVNSPTNIDGPITVCVEDNKQLEYNNHSHKHGKGHNHFVPNDKTSTIITIRGLFVVLALSVHELFEGLAVGLECSSKNVWYMFGAVSAHKLVIAFCIGMELVASGMKLSLVALYVFIFAVVSPLGIGIGLIITNEGQSTADLPSVFLQGLASGTLLYVVFFEILNAERKGGLQNFLAVLVGFLVMLSIKFIQD